MEWPGAPAAGAIPLPSATIRTLCSFALCRRQSPLIVSLRLRRANQSLECLDQKLGRVQNWTKEGQAPLSKAARQLHEINAGSCDDFKMMLLLFSLPFSPAETGSAV